MYQTKGHTSLKKTASQAEPPFVPRELVILFKIVKTLNRFFFLFFFTKQGFSWLRMGIVGWHDSRVQTYSVLLYLIKSFLNFLTI